MVSPLTAAVAKSGIAIELCSSRASAPEFAAVKSDRRFAQPRSSFRSYFPDCTQARR